ncbi:purine-nucleoside phosphorylase [Fangia hongkongensis]|uniref:purine-nucleoside phosphorylase n=1 Tax=Fangia hongkongensis TaxID=270495 RepID=UPI00036E55A7|nr:purine-nucleoside phosphorylase [Fangia hongkongensis]MBK2125011.1 purine-nucleoside phosphorylase [Fangia hongkongensis]
MIPTPHIEAKEKSLIAETVIMPGDPLRAKLIAEKYLSNIQQVNHVRNMLGFTGEYKGKKLTIMGSGMGMPSMGIYSHELFVNYDVKSIIRIGSCGAYVKEINVYDVILATESYSESDFIEIVTGEKTRLARPSEVLVDKAKAAASTLEIPLHSVKVHCTDVFYRKNFDDYKMISKEHGCKVVEMESAALFANAKAAGKNALCLLTVSDHLVTHEVTTSEERQNSFTQMIEIALKTALEL